MKSCMRILLSIFLFWGCAWTDIASVKDPDYNNSKFSKILVIAPFSDLEYRQKTEQKFQNEFAQNGIAILKSIDILPPTREFSQDEIFAQLTRYNIDGALIIAFKDYWTTETYVPRSSSTTGRASVVGNTLYYNQQTYNYGGYSFIKPNMSFELRLYDVNSGRIAWIAKSNTRGNAFADINTLINSLASETSKKMLAEGLLSNHSRTNVSKHNYDTQKQINNTPKTSTTTNTQNQPRSNQSAPTKNTRLPKFRKALPEFDKFTDAEIIKAYREKNPKYKYSNDLEIIRILESKYGKE